MATPRAHQSTCDACKQHSYWVEKQLVFPRLVRGPKPSADFTGPQRQLYEEARAVANDSPRAAALLRVLVENQIIELDTGGAANERLADKVKRLRKDGGVPGFLIEQMEAVRLTGNRALHPGQIDTSDAGSPNDDDLDLLFLLARSIVLVTKTLASQAAELATKQRIAKARSKPSTD